MPNRLGPSCFAWLLALAALPAQGNLGWRPDRLFAPRHANAIAFDPVRQRVLGFGGLQLAIRLGHRLCGGSTHSCSSLEPIFGVGKFALYLCIVRPPCAEPGSS